MTTQSTTGQALKAGMNHRLERLKKYRRPALELGCILLAVVLFCRGFLDFQADGQLPGVEGDVFQTLDWVLYNSVRSANGVPLWNHAIDTGMPYIADPMLHAYNPVVSLPVLLLGVWDGFKLGLLFSMLLAAVGMWWLMRTLCVRGPARPWAALMYTFAGQPNAHFLQGQYLFVLGFAWIPWSLAGLLRALRSRNPRDCAATVIPLALVFFSGNAYYSFYTLFAGLILAGGLILRSRRELPFIGVNSRRFRILVIIGLATLWLVSIQLLPSLEFIPYLNKAQEIAGSHTPWQVFLDFTSKDWFRPDAYSSLPAKEEFYAYLGYTPFLALIGLAKPAQRTRRWIKAFTLILGVSILWVALDYLPWREAFQDVRWLAQFRHLLRVLLFSGMALIVLAAFGLESLWDRLKQLKAVGDQPYSRAARLGSGILLAFMLLGPVDLFFTHRAYNRTQSRAWPTYHAAAWLKQEDPGHYFVRYEPATDGHDALAAAGHRFLEGWYHFTEMRSLNVDAHWNKRPVHPSPNYFIQFSGDAPPPVEGLVRIARTGIRDVYQNPGSLPYAFTIADSTLLEGTPPVNVTADEVQAVEASWLDNNNVQLRAVGNKDETLVLLLSYHPSWKASVDEEPIPTRNISGLMGLPLKPGSHTYQLGFQPASFFLGLAFSLGSMAIVGGWIFFPHILGWSQSGRRPIGQIEALQLVRNRASRLLEGLRLPPNSPALTISQKVRGKTIRIILGLEQTANTIASALLEKQIWIWTMGLALLVYALSRFIGIDRYPNYFFTDEAIQANLAADLIRDHFRGADGIFLPTYFKNVYEYNLSLSVYLQLLPTYLLGKSVLVTRMASAAVTIFGAAAVGLCFSMLTGKRWAWLGVMLFGLMPAWFLHSRTAFETSLMVSMYAGFLYAYMLYSIQSPRYIFLVVVFAALTFYSYAPGQIIILSTSMFLLLIDRRAHWKNRRTLLLAIPLLVLLAIPYFRFQTLLPGEHTNALRMLESHWVKEGTLISKLATSLGYYLQGLSPAYWFTPNVKDLVRHQVDAFGHLLLPTAPLLALGLVLAWRRRSEPAARVVLIALFSIPMAGVLVGVGITRVLSLVIPFALLSGLALVWLSERVRERANSFLLAIATFFLLAGIQAGMLADALIRGPEYTDEYGMIGLQWGARELFEEIKQLQQREPGLRIFLSPTWANGTDVLARFFIPDTNTLSIANAGGFLENMLDLNQEMVFVLTKPELDQLRSDPKIGSVQVLDEVRYPDGSPGFSFVTFSYSDAAKNIFAEEEAERRRPRVEVLDLQGQRVTLEFPYLDMGEVANLFDGDTYTLARVYDANPAILKLEFGEPRSVQGITLSTGSMDFELTLQALEGDGRELASTSGSYLGYPDDPTVELDFSDRVSNVSSLIIGITSLTPGDPFKIHLRELEVR